MIFLYIISVTLLLCFSALASASETAITAASHGKLQNIKAEGNDNAAELLELLKDKKRLISCLLIANNIVNILATSLVTGLLISTIGDHGTAYATLLMSVLIIVFAEVIPKALAVLYPEELSLRIFRVLIYIMHILTPVTNLLERFVHLVIKLCKLDNKASLSGADEVRGVIEYQLQEGNVYKDDRDMLGGILDLSTMTIDEVMIHRSKVLMVDIATPIDEIIKIVTESSYSRIPIWQDNSDNVIGILHVRHLWEALHAVQMDSSRISIKDLIVTPWFVPDHILIRKQLLEFRKKRSHFAVVVDEYGDLQGIITLEDILEEIVGQIDDENDQASKMIEKKGERTFVIEGQASIRDVNRELDWDLPESNASTIAGLIINHLGRIPDLGEKFEMLDKKISITKKESGSIQLVKIICSAVEKDDK